MQNETWDEHSLLRQEWKTLWKKKNLTNKQAKFQVMKINVGLEYGFWMFKFAV